MCDLIITDDDIREAEEAVLESGQTFNDEQVAFIKCLDSIDLDACPGSGKSTALVGKLFILAKYRVWENGEPICVVSHTNVAVDEIRDKVAKRFPEILAYPNFVGTLQAFVDEFLAIPHYRTLPFADRVIIDDEMFKSQWLAKFNVNDYQDASSKYIKARYCDRDTSGKTIWTTFNKERYEKFVASLSYVVKPINEYGLDLQSVNLKDSNNEKHKKLSATKSEIFQSGCLTFGDAYCLAALFVQKNEKAATIVGSRFKYVFLDEAQDTDSLQMSILGKLFDGPDHCFQRLGDPLQAIYDTESKEACAWIVREAPFALRLSGSNRFGSQIAAVVSRLSQIINSDSEEIAGGARTPQRCLLFPFDPGQEQAILAQFKAKVSEILGENTTGIYAVGAVGQKGADPNKLTIASFDQTYVKPKPKGINREYFSESSAYFATLTKQDVLSEGSSIIFRRLLLCIRNHVRRHSDSRVNLDELKEETLTHSSVFRSLVLDVARSILGDTQLPLQPIQDAINSYLQAAHSGIEPISLSSTTIVESEQPEDDRDESSRRKITLATIHAVKGQTHNATLLLTTQHKSLKMRSKDTLSGTDIDYLFKDNAATNRRKLIYVAASRPRHIFGWAIPREKIQSIDRSLLDLFEICEPT